MNRRAVLHLVDHKRALRVADIGNGGKFGEHKFAVALHVLYEDFKDIVVVPTHMKALGYFLKLQYLALELYHIFLGVLYQPYLAKYHKITAHLHLVHQGGVLGDHPVAFQSANTLVNGGLGQMQSIRILFGGLFTVLLQQPDQFNVHVIQFDTDYFSMVNR